MKKLLTLPRRAWHWLTSMRTALWLLFILAVAAVPGALLPQRSLNAAKVSEYLAEHGTLARWYDRLGLFDVFTSTWFIAIFLLLMISLVGCIIPRTWEHLRTMRTPPTRAPKVLTRMDHYVEGSVDKPIAEVREAVRAALKRWHVAEYSAEQDRAGALSFSAERGYLREVANLVFHFAILAVLVTVAVGRLVFYEGQVIVVTGGDKPEFCNTATANYDSFRAGRLFDGTGLHPFCFVAHDFQATYLANGQADDFSSTISYATGRDIVSDPAGWERFELKVNRPLRLAGDRVYLQGHGYAPTVTVTWPNGESRTQTMQFKPDDPTYFLSSGVLRFDPPAGMYPELAERRANQLAIAGQFAPTAVWSGANGDQLTSAFPAPRNPGLAVDVYRGDNGLDTGRGQSIFELDQRLIETGQLAKVDRLKLAPGESARLEDGTTITFDAVREYANYQVSYNPTQEWVLAFAVLGLAGITGSLLIKRRRIWVRLRPAPGGGTRVEVAGRARTDSAGWGEEFERIARHLLELPDPDDEDEGDYVPRT